MASISRAPLELLDIEEVPEPKMMPDSPIMLPGLQGYIRKMRLNYNRDRGEYEDERGGFIAMSGLATTTVSFDLTLSGPVVMDDSLRNLLTHGGYVHILSAKPPNEVGMK